jgi:multiple sugar transport system permease protein
LFTFVIKEVIVGMKNWIKIVSPYLYVLPALAMVTIFLLWPALDTGFISFTSYNLLTPPRFIGISNYIRLFEDPFILNSFLNTLWWTILTIILSVGLGLLFAVGVNRLKFSGFFKFVFYIPLTLSAVVIGVLWVWIYQSNGLVNTILNEIGLGGWSQTWLLNVPINTFCMIIAWVWATAGQNMVLFLIGLQTLPTEVIEAADLDGANAWQRFWHVTFPLLTPMTTVAVTMSLINSLNQFNIIYVMTGGGPYRSSETLAVSMYRESFTMMKFGYGAAIAVVLTIIVFVTSWIYMRHNFKRERDVY